MHGSNKSTLKLESRSVKAEKRPHGRFFLHKIVVNNNQGQLAMHPVNSDFLALIEELIDGHGRDTTI